MANVWQLIELEVWEDRTMTRGCFAVVVGPDGVGKTTFSSALLALQGDSGRYFHFRPPVKGGLHRVIPETAAMPKHQSPVFAPAGWLRLAVAVPRFWLGFLASVLPELRRGGFVLADRWAFGYLAQPLSLRFAGPAGLARVALALMPKPDIVFNLAASSEVILSRKAELTERAINEELSAWKTIPGRVVTLDARQSPEELARQALHLITR